MNPKALDSRPEIYPWMGEYVEAFTLLGSKRPSGFGPSPISLSDIHAYVLMFGCSDLIQFIRLITDMDSAYLVESDKKAKQEAKNERNGAKR